MWIYNRCVFEQVNQECWVHYRTRKSILLYINPGNPLFILCSRRVQLIQEHTLSQAEHLNQSVLFVMDRILTGLEFVTTSTRCLSSCRKPYLTHFSEILLGVPIKHFPDLNDCFPCSPYFSVDCQNFTVLTHTLSLLSFWQPTLSAV